MMQGDAACIRYDKMRKRKREGGGVKREREAGAVRNIRTQHVPVIKPASELALITLIVEKSHHSTEREREIEREKERQKREYLIF